MGRGLSSSPVVGDRRFKHIVDRDDAEELVVGVDDRAARLARYTRAAASQLDAQAEEALLAGKAAFPNPEAFAHA